MSTTRRRLTTSRARRAVAGAGPGRDAGVATVELALYAPVLLLLFALIIAAGRLAQASNTVTNAAAAAAREASIARTAGAAQSAALASAASYTSGEGLRCTSVHTSADVGGFSVAVGQPASVRVTVSCTVPLSDLAHLPGLPGQKTLTSTSASPLDSYRSRTQ